MDFIPHLHVVLDIFLLVDDCTRNTWEYLLNSKSNAFSKIEFFLNMIKNQFNTTIKCFCSDNAQDFLSGPVQNLFHKNDILHEPTIVDTPQQNGVAERKHQHIFNVAR